MRFPDPLSRRELLAAFAAATLPKLLSAQAAKPAMVVYKSPSCGCCKLWVDHLRAAGFAVSVRDQADVSGVKTRYRVPGRLHSCHTAIVAGYVIEGHVPADLVQKLLKDKPPVVGLAVPGMPSGSPGMEGGAKEPYEVLTFDAAGKTTVYDTR